MGGAHIPLLCEEGNVCVEPIPLLPVLPLLIPCHAEPIPLLPVLPLLVPRHLDSLEFLLIRVFRVVLKTLE